MARVKLSHPDQPLGIRLALQLYEFLASLKLAVVLIFTIAMLLMAATFVEANFGTSAVHWYIYQTWWFITIHILLAINIFCAASIRYPWKRYQTGFVITHIGLLILLAGSAISYRKSLNSQMLVYEGDHSEFAIDTDETWLVFNNVPGKVEPVDYKFQSGPFNWGDQPFTRVLLMQLNRWSPTRGFLKMLDIDPRETHRPHAPELVFQNDKAKLEIVDFYSRAEDHSIPFVRLNFYNPLVGMELSQELNYSEFESQGNKLGFDQVSFGGMGGITLMKADSEAEVESFLGTKPSRGIDEKSDGAVIVWHKGEAHQVPIAVLKKKVAAGEPYELSTGLKLKLRNFNERYTLPFTSATLKQFPWVSGRPYQSIVFGPMVALDVQQPDKDEFTLVERFADFPWMSENLTDDLRIEFFHPSMLGRIDVMQGPDKQLYYRVWQQKQGRVVASGSLNVEYSPQERTFRSWQPVNTWSTGGNQTSGEQGFWQMSVDQYIPESPDLTRETKTKLFTFDDSNEPREQIKSGQMLPVPLPFSKDDSGVTKRAKVRLSLKNEAGEWEEANTFWLRLNLPQPWQTSGRHTEFVKVKGEEEDLAARFQVKQTPVGFAVKLVEFDLEVDAGTSTASNYTSQVVQVDVRNEKTIQELREKIDAATTAEDRQAAKEELVAEEARLISNYVKALKDVPLEKVPDFAANQESLEYHIITMNAPLDYPDLQGRTLRFFQESYSAPDKEANRPPGSVLRVNYDPGRPVKYFGSLLICVGVFIMFYMRAYFFKTPRRAPVTQVTTPLPTPVTTSPAPVEESTGNKSKRKKKKRSGSRG